MNYYPDMPPVLEGETDEEYTDRLTGADRTGRIPYDHARYRQCSIGYHEECSDPFGEVCKCPHHYVKERSLGWREDYTNLRLTLDRDRPYAIAQVVARGRALVISRDTPPTGGGPFPSAFDVEHAEELERRIVACVNYCVDITTIELENDVETEGIIEGIDV